MEQEGLLPDEGRKRLYRHWHYVAEETSRRRWQGGSSASKHWIDEEWHRGSPPGLLGHQLISPPGHQVRGRGFSVKVWCSWHSVNKGSGLRAPKKVMRVQVEGCFGGGLHTVFVGWRVSVKEKSKQCWGKR